MGFLSPNRITTSGSSTGSVAQKSVADVSHWQTCRWRVFLAYLPALPPPDPISDGRRMSSLAPRRVVCRPPRSPRNSRSSPRPSRSPDSALANLRRGAAGERPTRCRGQQAHALSHASRQSKPTRPDADRPRRSRPAHLRRFVRRLPDAGRPERGVGQPCEPLRVGGETFAFGHARYHSVCPLGQGDKTAVDEAGPCLLLADRPVSVARPGP